MTRKQRVTPISKKAQPVLKKSRSTRSGTSRGSDKGRRNLTLMASAGGPRRAKATVDRILEYYRPLKKPVTLRLDADVIAWFKKDGKRYQTRINIALRRVMEREMKEAHERTKPGNDKMKTRGRPPSASPPRPDTDPSAYVEERRGPHHPRPDRPGRRGLLPGLRQLADGPGRPQPERAPSACGPPPPPAGPARTPSEVAPVRIPPAGTCHPVADRAAAGAGAGAAGHAAGGSGGGGGDGPHAPGWR